jgi:hypothetical protein
MTLARLSLKSAYRVARNSVSRRRAGASWSVTTRDPITGNRRSASCAAKHVRFVVSRARIWAALLALGVNEHEAERASLTLASMGDWRTVVSTYIRQTDGARHAR